MIPIVTREDISQVLRVLEVFQDTHYGKWAAVKPLVEQLSASGSWLMSFALYVSATGRIWKGVQEDKYFAIPAASNPTATFKEFVELLRFYGGRKVTHKNERELISFLSRCSQDEHDFYLGILSRERFFYVFENRDLRANFNFMPINTEEIYGSPSLLKEGWFAVTYPLVVSTVPSSNLQLAALSRLGNNWSFKFLTPNYKSNRTYNKVKIPLSFLGQDRKFIHTDSFVLFGLVDEANTAFYPLDYFDGLRDYSRHHKKPKVPFEQRLENLEKFLSTSFLKVIKKVPKAYCRDSSYVERAVGEVLQNTDNSTVVFCDATGRMHYVQATTREGVIGGVHTNSTTGVYGLKVWSNAVCENMSFDFSGENNALLYHPKVILGKHCIFKRFEFKDFSVGAVTEILWDKKPYYPAVEMADGSKGYLERCPFCLRDDTHHFDYAGVCKNTYNNWRTMFGANGPEVWFTPSKKILKRREQLGWAPSAINNVVIAFRGHRLVANEEGQLLFRLDPELLAKYQHYLEFAQGGRNFVAKLTYTTDLLVERYRDYFKIKGVKDEANRTGAVCEVQQLHEPDSVESGKERGSLGGREESDPDYSGR